MVNYWGAFEIWPLPEIAIGTFGLICTWPCMHSVWRAAAGLLSSKILMTSCLVYSYNLATLLVSWIIQSRFPQIYAYNKSSLGGQGLPEILLWNCIKGLIWDTLGSQGCWKDFIMSWLLPKGDLFNCLDLATLLESLERALTLRIRKPPAPIDRGLSIYLSKWSVRSEAFEMGINLATRDSVTCVWKASVGRQLPSLKCAYTGEHGSQGVCGQSAAVRKTFNIGC